ncbi:MAG: prevent-host-death protein [Actinomyces succiniciruminis]|nr:prevent-host-death protein [Actinomyces succiniciruminis]
MSLPHRKLFAIAGRVASALLLLAAVLALTWWGTGSPRATSQNVTATAVPAPAADVVYACPAAPNNTIGGVDLDEPTVSTTITALDADSTLTYGSESLEDATTTLDTADGGILTVRAPGSQSAGAVGVVTTLTAGGDLRGLSAAPCATPASVAWIVGGSAAVGSSSELRLTNPGLTTVTATIHLYGSTGELTLPSSGQVAVGAGETVGVLLEAAGAADDRLALSVEADGGALIPALVTESLDGETPAGVDTLTAGAAPATDLTIPGVVLVEAAAQGETEADGADSSDSPAVRVVNPAEAPATVSISLIGADGEEDLPGATAVTVDPGAVFDISLAGVDPGAYAVHVTSDATVGAAVKLVRSAGEYPDRSGALAHDTAWVQAAADAAGSTLALPREGSLDTTVVLTNSGAADATVTLTSADGEWTDEVTVPATTTLTPRVPDEVSALVITGAGGQQVSAAAVVTTEVSGDVPGTLISVLPTVPDAAAQSSRNLRLY